MTILWLRLKMTIKNSWWWTYLTKEHREKNLIEFTDEELDDMYEDDTIDVKNFYRMDPGPARDEMRQMLVDRRDWYIQQRLGDWAEQVDVALWSDERYQGFCTLCRKKQPEWADRSGNRYCISCAMKLNGCEICASTSLMTREGEQLHYKEDCFK